MVNEDTPETHLKEGKFKNSGLVMVTEDTPENNLKKGKFNDASVVMATDSSCELNELIPVKPQSRNIFGTISSFFRTKKNTISPQDYGQINITTSESQSLDQSVT